MAWNAAYDWGGQGQRVSAKIGLKLRILIGFPFPFSTISNSSTACLTKRWDLEKGLGSIR